MRDLAADADRLRALHAGFLLLANAWDAASARLVEEAGFPVVATSSAAVAAVRGAADDDSMGADAAFAAVAGIAAAVSVPVTADLEAGYGLDGDELVRRLLAAGAVGCNLEDSDHRGGGLVAPELHAEQIRAVKESGRRAGVDVVVNARVDAYVRGLDDPLGETLRRGRFYREAGADCVYPIFLADPAQIRELVAELGVVNVLLRPGGPSAPELRGLGVARASVGSGLFKVAQAAARQEAERLLAGLAG